LPDYLSVDIQEPFFHSPGQGRQQESEVFMGVSKGHGRDQSKKDSSLEDEGLIGKGLWFL